MSHLGVHEGAQTQEGLMTTILDGRLYHLELQTEVQIGRICPGDLHGPVGETYPFARLLQRLTCANNADTSIVDGF